MASNAGAIKAGRAYVEIYGDKSPLMRSLASAKKSLASWGESIASIGIFAAGGVAAIAAPVIAVSKSFADFGGAIDDVAQRTGASVETLSILKYAAEKTGASFEDVEKGFRFLAKSGKFAGDGVDESFRSALDYIASIEDPIARSRAAMELFGKSGANLIPLASEIDELERSAKGLGVVMSAEAANSAAALGDAWHDLMTAGQGMVNQLGAALAPALTEAIELMTDFASVIANGGILEAGKLVWSGLSAITAEGIAFVANATKDGFKAAASFLIDSFATIQAGWVEMTEFMATLWNATTNKIAHGILHIMKLFDDSLDLADAQANLDQDTAARQRGFDERRTDRLKEVQESADRWKVSSAEGIDSFAQSAAEQALAEMEKFRGSINRVREERKGGKQAEKAKEAAASLGDKVSSVGTFSGQLAGGLGAGNRLDEIAVASKQTAVNTKKIAGQRAGLGIT